jgi:putative ABC transport system ATP-binding protein
MSGTGAGTAMSGTEARTAMSGTGAGTAPSGRAPAVPAVRCENLVHVFGTPGNEVAALRGVDLVIDSGEMVALLGPSGAGKTTLLWHLAGLLAPTAGVVEINGLPLSGLSGRALTSMRLREVGLLLQNPASNLLPSRTALGNVLFAQSPTRRTRAMKRRRASDLLDRVGLAEAARRPAGLLSGGEQQRLALAVALANGPRLLLADEPTSQLDPASAADVIELIQAANASLGTTIVAVTHDPEVAVALGRTITIRDGRVGGAGHGGREFVVISKDGTLTLPADVLDELPPGSLAEATRAEGGGILLRRADLSSTDLSSTDLSGTDLSGTDLSDSGGLGPGGAGKEHP